MLASMIIVNPCLPHNIRVQCTVCTPEAQSRTARPSMDNDAIRCKIRQVMESQVMETAVILVKFMQDADARHVSSFRLDTIRCHGV